MNDINEFNQAVGYPLENWTAVKSPSKHNIQGSYCLLEVLDVAKHGTKLFDNLSLNNRGESWTYLPYGPFNHYAEFEDWIKKTTAEQDTLLYAIIDVKSQLPIGIAGYLRINPEHGVIEIGHLHFSNLLKKTPAATEAIYLLLYQAFEELKYRRCEWKCHSLNEASQKAAVRLGFQFEGIFRQHNVFKQRNRNTAWFSIIDSEWPELMEKFKLWLNSNNFGSDGQQRLKLQEVCRRNANA